MKQAKSDTPTVTESTIVPGTFHVVMGDFEDVCVKKDLKETIQEVEDAYYLAALEAIDGNMTDAMRIKLREEGFARTILPPGILQMERRKDRKK